MHYLAPSFTHISFLFLFIFLSRSCQSQNTSLYDAIPQLQSLDLPRSDRAPSVGGQNFTFCCILAVEQSYEINNDILTLIPNTFLSVGGPQFVNSRFPCGATYDGDSNGAPIVQVPWAWCRSYCPGFQLSNTTPLTQWVQPLVGFVLPVAVFCLGIPRRTKVRIPEALFRHELPQFYISVFTAPLAVLYAIADTSIWIAIVFSTATPMIISSIYEALTDRRVMKYLAREENLSFALKTHLLYATLVGNLEVWDRTVHKRLHKNEDPENFTMNGKSNGLQSPSESHSIAWKHVKEDLVEGLNRLEPSQRVPLTRTRLNTMLSCQYSFGSVVGAPVVFFIGSYLFSLISVLTTYGDNDTAHALAFGMWWMIMPHCAIVSGCLLAGNNPNTLEALMSGLRSLESSSSTESNTTSIWQYFQFESVYASDYMPAAIWRRGASKRSWIKMISNEPEYRYKRESIRKLIRLDIYSWTYLIGFTATLLGIPFVLAFLTSYFTPPVGLSCRSFTFLLYVVFQVWLTIFWIFDFETRHRFYKRWRGIYVVTPIGILILLGLIGSLFTSIGGTLMQLIGIYRSCLCIMPISQWPYPKGFLPLSTNSAEDIRLAREWWLPTGIAAMAGLTFFTYMGWWYQRHLKLQFRDIVDRLECPTPQR